MMRIFTIAALMLSVTGCVRRVVVVHAERHPAYAHAIEDLRLARAHLEQPATVTARTAWDQAVAIREIDAAIQEERVAAYDDGKNLAVLPRADLPPDWAGRLHRSLELLERARADTAREEDNRGAQGAQHQAIERIDAAISLVRQGIAANVPPPPVVVVAPPPPPVEVIPPARHPPYLHALEDLRHARAVLARPAAVTGTTAWDESAAIAEIDAALGEIKQAAIDDGKNLNEHPPVDVRMKWNARLHRTLDLLRKARQDVSHEEDNGAAQGLQRRAAHHIDGAITFVEQGIAANHY